MAYRLLRLAAAPALAAFLVVGMALPASATTTSSHASDTAAAQSSSSNAGGNSADHANDNAGANANAANNPHAADSSSSSSSQSASSGQAASTSSTSTGSTSANTSAGNPNAGCNQTPYGSTGPGANHSGPYNDTCTGAASGNGNGGGKAVGKPCAGCVGKADEKNPKGQYPNGSDHNKGYECDGNKGIGQTNPAHTGCVPTPQTPPPPPSTPPVTPPSVSGTEVSRTGTPAAVLGEVLLRSPASVEAAVATRGGALPRTGMDLMSPTLLGAALLALGSLLLKLAKRRPA
jgi:cobalamin biosynthesis Mg chelatase CobN